MQTNIFIPFFFPRFTGSIVKVVYATKCKYTGKYDRKKVENKFEMMSRIEKLLDLLSLNNTDSFLQHALALEYIKAGDEMRAKAFFKQILAHEPGYVGSYFHLGKLLERINEPEAAIEIYETGMKECKKVNDRHAYNELQSALEDLT
jgi:tetratricopeptide (TPR) repeat protein